MAKLKTTDFNMLLSMCRHPGGNGVGSTTIGENTTAGLEDDTVIIKLHGNEIVRLTKDTVAFNMRGYKTKTTRERINQFLPEGYRLYQKGLFQMLKIPNRPRDIEVTATDWWEVRR